VQGAGSEGNQPRVEGEALGVSASRRSWFGIFTMVLNIVGTLLIIVMAVAVNADILGRELFNRPIAGVTEFVGLAIVAIVFLQMANTSKISSIPIDWSSYWLG
jgi:hypothetical protein